MPKVNGKTVPCHGYTSLTSAQKQLISSALSHFDCASAQDEPDLLGNYYIACDATGTAVDLLGHVVVRGAQIDSASAVAPSTNGQGNTDWTVNLNLGGAGADNWSAWTSKFNTKKLGLPDSNGGQATSCAPPSTPCSLFVGFTLDGAVLSLPITNASLSTQTTVSGSFTEKSAKDLAQELNYGKLPITFKADSIRNVSATLGTSQLHGAFIAGGIGLILVVLYSLIYYRALGLVTIASLIVSAALTYSMLVILATQIGFTLDLAGIAGFIVALGITADSFVVFFERIKDEVHEGRSLRVAVPRAWVRARRTILSADTVSFLAAAILYFFASADVKGFAFTLGMSTILDLVVVFLFTHPMVSLLSRSRAFGSARFTGLANVRAGGIAAPSADDERQLARPRRTPRRSATATLEKPEVEEQTTEDAVDEAGPAEPAGEAEQPRRRTTPQAGTAAERAAQRRARMRQRDEGEQG
jgi:preprotein translocase subunit SecD